MVEGINYANDLTGVFSLPVQLAVPNRLVYSAHDYSPKVWQQSWFADPKFPANLPALWDRIGIPMGLPAFKKFCLMRVI